MTSLNNFPNSSWERDPRTRTPPGIKDLLSCISFGFIASSPFPSAAAPSPQASYLGSSHVKLLQHIGSSTSDTLVSSCSWFLAQPFFCSQSYLPSEFLLQETLLDLPVWIESLFFVQPLYSVSLLWPLSKTACC